MPDTTPAASRLNVAPTPRESPRDVDRENSVLRELVTVYRHLSGLAMQDADLAGVVQLISERATATVAVVSQLMDVQTAASPGLPPEKAAALVREHVVHPRLGQVLRASRLSQRALRLPNVGGVPAIIVAPILVGDEVPSYLITLDPAEESFGEDMSLLVTEHAATICGVILGRERVVAAAARRVRDDLVEGLLLGRGRDAADAARWAAHLGYDPARAHHVAAIAFELPPARAADAEPLRQRIRESIEHFVTTRAPEAIVSAREAEVVVVAAATPDPRKLGQACLARLAELFPGARVVIGIGGPCRDPRSRTWASTGCCCRCRIWASYGHSPPKCWVSSASTSTSTSPSTCPPWPATSGRTTARNERRGCCTSTPTRWPTGSSGSRRSPACGWTTTGTGSSRRWR
jgi:hypothetical protein